ncbi:LOW QUALITY PROTEIN: T-box transcription factor TBX6L-like [Salvelinus alpinus]
MINGNRMHLSSISSFIAKGLNTYVNKWSRDHWVVSGMTEPHLPNRFFIHPNSPALGERWMQCPVSFHNKLTNTLNSNSLVVLHSMYKYQPRLHIVLSPDPHSPLSGDYLRFTFPEAAFIAVTAYQNSEITKLKIDNNPFAKGFRDNGLNGKSSSSVDFHGAVGYRTDDITSLSAVPDPFISAFMNWGAAAAKRDGGFRTQGPITTTNTTHFVSGPMTDSS